MSAEKSDKNKPVKKSTRDEESEFTRTKKNEKRLFDENKELKRQIADFIRNENSAKKIAIEYGKLQQKVKELELLAGNLRNDLQQTKSKYAKEKSEKIHLKTDLEQRNLNLESKNQDLQNKYSVEKSMRTQLEQQLEKFDEIKEERDKLATNNKTLSHKVEELSGYKQCTSKSVQELKQLVRQKDAEHDKTKYDLCDARSDIKRLHESMAHIIQEKEKLEGAHVKVLEMRDQIKGYQKQIDFEKTVNYKTNRENRQLLVSLDQQRNRTVDAERRADLGNQACKEKDEEIDHHHTESKKQRLIIRKLEEEVNKFNDLKHKLQNLDETDIAFSHAKDRVIINMRNEMKDMEFEIGRLNMYISSQKVTGELAFKNLSTAQIKIRDLEATNQTLIGEIQINKTDIISKKSNIVKFERKYRCAKKQLERLKVQLSEIKIKQQTCATSADRDQAVTNKTLANVSAERDQLKKQLGNTQDLLFAQQQRVNAQEAERLKQKTDEKVKDQELRIARLSMKDLEQNNRLILTQMLKKPFSRPKSCTSASIFYQKPKVQEPRLQETSPKEENEKENEKETELKRKLDEALMKLHERRWDIRKLEEKNKSLQGQLRAYVLSQSTCNEKNFVLQDELRNIKLEIWEKSKAKPVPPVSMKNQAPPEEKPVTGCTSRQTRIVLPSTNLQYESKDKLKTPLLPSIQGKPMQLPKMSAQPCRPSEGKSGHGLRNTPSTRTNQPPRRPPIILPPLRK